MSNIPPCYMLSTENTVWMQGTGVVDPTKLPGGRQVYYIGNWIYDTSQLTSRVVNDREKEQEIGLPPRYDPQYNIVREFVLERKQTLSTTGAQAPVGGSDSKSPEGPTSARPTCTPGPLIYGDQKFVGFSTPTSDRSTPTAGPPTSTFPTKSTNPPPTKVKNGKQEAVEPDAPTKPSVQPSKPHRKLHRGHKGRLLCRKGPTGIVARWPNRSMAAKNCGVPKSMIDTFFEEGEHYEWYTEEKVVIKVIDEGECAGVSVSDTGNVWSTAKCQQVEPIVRRDKKPLIQLPHWKHSKNLDVVVCTAFHGPPASNQMFVHHVDDDESNNSAENLIWKRKNRGSRVMCYRGDTFVRGYGSMADATQDTGVAKSGISRCCEGKRKTAGGFVWRMED